MEAMFPSRLTTILASKWINISDSRAQEFEGSFIGAQRKEITEMNKSIEDLTEQN